VTQLLFRSYVFSQGRFLISIASESQRGLRVESYYKTLGRIVPFVAPCFISMQHGTALTKIVGFGSEF